MDEVVKLENKIAFCYKSTNKDIVVTDEDMEDSKKITIVVFVEKILKVMKLEIIVSWQVITEDQLIVNVIIM